MPPCLVSKSLILISMVSCLGGIHLPLDFIDVVSKALDHVEPLLVRYGLGKPSALSLPKGTGFDGDRHVTFLVGVSHDDATCDRFQVAMPLNWKHVDGCCHGSSPVCVGVFLRVS